jgi:hypothetical protein
MKSYALPKKSHARLNESMSWEAAYAVTQVEWYPIRRRFPKDIIHLIPMELVLLAMRLKAQGK